MPAIALAPVLWYFAASCCDTVGERLLLDVTSRRHHLSEHKQGRLLPPGSALATSELRGNWLVVSNDVVWRLHAHDYRGATTVL